ncbi:hypothetical protein PP509_gp33 [Gordonia phage MichaelScott]|uniref:Uncharacterized protein n=4 Tax=Beenievirus TaxID=3044673 RepID=A0A5P8DCN6_9CAUD|nr:hypothetical protein PP502_gp28 [Gordonia phage Beenie]YP_010654277.1 hypothetical protein PP505_gp30 [Gordonia phage Dorito]YP_010654350.1 hypothetical protein PP506_gp28 [Gordonia phage DobbysSock]YP_010654585.1 hypothetical protein PP509_gp33 [Gordonia phage MichaelScott]AUV61593.1 hypothetical protein PBI_BEENIE_28 [Gordonia phage Beenie]AZS07300.1 hypothetical protein PBI_DORITO_30 [Gordonia phage Dorito]QFP96149.1 hypothetical protein DOBBYSSOCK_SEA_28 [Gordonia phage DobbysSock]QOC
MTDRDVLRAAAEDIRAVMRRQQAEMSQAADGGWAPPDPGLLALAVECDDVIYSQRREATDLTDRLAAVLGDDWEP